MRKSIALLLSAFFLFISSGFFVSAAEERKGTDEEVLSIAARTVMAWYCTVSFVCDTPVSNDCFSGWQPEDFNYSGEITENKQETLMLFAWISRMFFDDSFNYGEQYHVSGGDDEKGMLFEVPERVMLETINMYLACPNISLEEWPFYDKHAKAFLLRVPGGIGGGTGGEGDWTLTQTSDGNWLAHFSCLDRYLLDVPSPELEDITLELTPEYKVVSINMRVPLQSLQWKTAPQKTSYRIGEALDFSGSTLKATHASGASWDVPITADMVSGYNPSRTGQQTIRVNYHNKYLDFNVTVQAASTDSNNRPSEPTTSAKPTDGPQTPPTKDEHSEPIQPGITTIPDQSESTPSESIIPSENEKGTSVQSTEKTQISGTTPEKDSGFPLWGMILLAGIVVVAGGAATVVILMKMGKIPFLKK